MLERLTCAEFLRESLTWVLRFAPLSCAITPLSCTTERGQSDILHQRAPIIYGSDDRSESLDVSAWWELARASVAFVPETALSIQDDGHVRLVGPTLKDALGVCPDEPFAEEPVVSTCSGTLVAPDLVLTAGHCVSATGCNASRVVFGYALGSDGQVPVLSAERVASCMEIVSRCNADGIDFALVRIDRTPLGVSPVPVRVGDRALETDQRLLVIGHPTGLPQKIADNAWVSAARANTLDFFSANLDAFPGSSGGGVFVESSGELAGLVARGPDGGYVKYPGESCYRVQRVADGYATSIESTYVARAVSALCATTPSTLLCACGNRSCEEALGENSASCPNDCGSYCGDAACNGTESGASCYSDCGACGNAVCEPYEIGHLSCCEDCGCPNGFECSSSTCLARLGNVNHDERVDLEDVALLSSQLSLGRLPVQADVDCNGSIDNRDVEALAARVAGATTQLPCEAPADVAIGLRHTCALTHGKVRCFGDNSMGQLGTSDRPLGASAAHSVEVPLPSGAVALAAGSVHTCARLADGRVACWGDNQFGQLGGNPSRRGAVVIVGLSEPAIDVKAGAGHSCALMGGGAVRCWGDNQFGQLGLGPRPAWSSLLAPAVLPAPATAIALGASHSCALIGDGSVRCWGLNQFGQLGLANTQNLGDDEEPVTASAIDLGGSARNIFAHWMQTCALRTDGTVVCWGDNSFAQLGVPTPARIGDDEPPSDVGPIALGGPISALALGQTHTCALYVDASMRCWGLGLNGALGSGQTLPPPLPQPPGAPPLPSTPPSQLPPVPLGSPVSALYAGSQMTCARTSSGELYCFGANFSGQLGYASRNNIGDDETPGSIGPVPLVQEPELGWSFVEAPGLEARLRVNSNQHASHVTLSLRSPILEEDLRAIYPFSTIERPGTEVVMNERAKDTRLWSELTPDLYALEFLFEKRLRACAPERFVTEQAQVGFRRPVSGWDPTNDYGASATAAQAWTSSPRVQILSADGTVYQGWSRAPSAP